MTRAEVVEAVLEEFDLLCLGRPSPERLEREVAMRVAYVRR